MNNEFWQIPFSRQPGMLWAGFSSEALTGQAQGSLLLNMESMSGPQRWCCVYVDMGWKKCCSS